MTDGIAFVAYDKINRSTYPVVRIEWTYGFLVRKYYDKNVTGSWVPAVIVLLHANGKERIYSYMPRKNMPKGFRVRDIRDITLSLATQFDVPFIDK